MTSLISSIGLNNKLKVYHSTFLWITQSRFKGDYSAEIKSKIKSLTNFQMQYKQNMPRTMEEMSKLVNRPVESPEGSRLIKVAMVGVPNSGKSTLVNNITGHKVSTVSKKVHTTLRNTQAICNSGSTQMILYDSPGVITPQEFSRHKIGVKSHLVDPEKCFHEVDLVAVVHDVSNHHTRERLHPHVIKLLALHPTVPAILILNKIDSMKKEYKSLLHTTYSLTTGKLQNEPACEIEEIKSRMTDKEIYNKLLGNKSLSTEQFNPKSSPFYFDTKQPGYISHGEVEEKHVDDVKLLTDGSINIDDLISGKLQLTEHQAIQLGQEQTGWPMFQEVFMVSAKTGNGLEAVKQYLLESAYSSKWIYNHQMVTNLDPFEVVILAVRERFLETLPWQLPYILKYEIENWNFTSSEVLEISVVVTCPKYTQIKLISSFNISKISQMAAEEIRNIFCCEVILNLSIKSLEPEKLPSWKRRIISSRKGNRLSLLKKINTTSFENNDVL